MGNEPSKPEPGTRFQVIGAGMPCTGTASLSEALGILLDGPIYHGGTHIAKGNPREIISWVRLLKLFPLRTNADRHIVLDTLRNRFDGYAGVTDQPASVFITELLDLYPNVIVICTVRDPTIWEHNITRVSNTASAWFLRLLLLPLPGLRHFVGYVNLLRRAFVHLYGERGPPNISAYYRHIEWLREVVPEERLFFVDVKDGWGPLCDALGMEAPNVPFPVINDEEAMEMVAKETITRALRSWALVLATLFCIVAAYRWFTG